MIDRSSIIRIAVANNPKKPGSFAFQAFEKLQAFDGKTVSEFYEATPNFPPPRELKWWRGDLRSNGRDGYVELLDPKTGGPVLGEDTDQDASDDIDAAEELTFQFERDLQRALRANLAQLETRLEIADGGTERQTTAGKIDILARDGAGQLVVIELKAVEAHRDAIGQLLGYMGALMAETPSTPVRGILVAPAFEERTILAAKPVTTIKLFKYRFNFSFESI